MRRFKSAPRYQECARVLPCMAEPAPDGAAIRQRAPRTTGVTYHLNEAAARQARVLFAAYARAQLSGYRGFLLDFTGLTKAELAEWEKTGRVSDRWLRVCFHWFKLARNSGDIILSSNDTGIEIARVLWDKGWRENLMAGVTVSVPGAENCVRAYIETQVPAW